MSETLALPGGLTLRDFAFVPTSERALRMVKPETLEAYLLSRGWKAVSAWEKAALYRGTTATVLVPRDSSFLDYHVRISEALANLSRDEDRTQFEVFCDVLAADSAPEAHPKGDETE